MADKVMDMSQKELFETFVEALRAVNVGGGGKSSSSSYYNFRNGGGNSLAEIYSRRKDKQEFREEKEQFEELLEKAGKKGAILNKSDKEFLSAHGIEAENIKELRENTEKLTGAIDELDKKDKSCNFGNRLIGYNNIIKKIGGAFKGMDQSIMGFVNPWAKADAAASKYAKTIGATKAGMESLRSTTIDNVVKSHIGIDFNMSTEELIEAQQNYVNGVGRSLRIDNNSQTALAAMHAVMGGQEQELAVAFENFGVNLEKTGEHAGKMFTEASKTGISFAKYSDTVAKNIKIAQNYTFKNGLKGLESMAKKAVALKMDMGQVASLAEKVSSVEGAIDVSSKLQVLGGQFAAMSDPLGMMNEGLLDMEGLMDRVTKMVGGLGGFDKATGEVKVSAFNKQRIKAAAQAMGMDYSQLMESVNAQAKRKEIESQIIANPNARGLSEDMQELIKNSATFDKEGRAGVSIGGEFKTIDKLTNDDYEELVKETQNESADIKDIAKNVRSLYEIRSGIKKQKEAVQAKATEKLGLGDFMKKITSAVGHMNAALWILVRLQGVSAVIDVFSNGADILDMVGGRGRRAGRMGNRIKRGIGRTKPGKAVRRAKVGVRKSFRRRLGNGIAKTKNVRRVRSTRAAGRVRTGATRTIRRRFGNGIAKTKNVRRVRPTRAAGRVRTGATRTIRRRFGNEIAKTKNVRRARPTRAAGRLRTGATKTIRRRFGNGITRTTRKGAIRGLGRGRLANAITRRSGERIANRLVNKSLIGLGKVGAGSIKTVGNLGSSLTKKGFTKLGGAVTRHAERRAAKTAIKGVASKTLIKEGANIGAKSAVKVGAKLAAGVAKGGIAGAIGTVGNIVTDMGVASGRIKKGGVGHSSLKIGFTAAEYAGLGAMLSPILGPIGPAIGAIAGLAIGTVKAVKNKREAKLDENLAQMGLKRKGDYGARSYKLINKAIETGELSDRMRKKLLKKGDKKLVEQIDAVKAEKEAKSEAKANGEGGQSIETMNSDIKEATLKIEKAFMNGKETENKASGIKKIEEKEFPNETVRTISRILNPLSIFRGTPGVPMPNSVDATMSMFKPIAETGMNDDVKKLFEEIKAKALEAEKQKNEENSKKYDNNKNNGNEQQTNNNQQQQQLNNKIELNITGTIKLVGADGKNADITKELLDDRDFRKELAELIKNQLNENARGNYIPQVNLARK